MIFFTELSFFNSLSWLHGAYGVTGPNENIPHKHFYVTVKNGTDESKVLDDLETTFDCKPNDYFEIRPEPKAPQKFRFLTKPASGGCIRALDRGPNPARAPNDIVDQRSGSSGTLTMFCFHNNKHYALTCFHVGCKTDEQRYDEVFSPEKLRGIRESHDIDWHKQLAKNNYEYLYSPSENPGENGNEKAAEIVENIPLGMFSEGSFDTKSDILSIEVSGDVEIDCRMTQVDSPSWLNIWQELHDRVYIPGEEVSAIIKKVGYPSNVAYGYIEDINFSYKTEEGQTCYKSAISIRSNSGLLLRPGDSGALVCFVDRNNKEQACGYVVCQASDDDGGIVFLNEGEPLPHEENGSVPILICLRLDTALIKLDLPTESGCFERCGSDQQ